MLDPQDVRHFCRRAGFGASPGEVRSLSGLGTRRALVDHVLSDRRARTRPVLRPRPPKLSPPECNSAAPFLETQQVGRWWLERMRRARWQSQVAEHPHPLREKMTLFWHGLLVSSLRKGTVYCTHKNLLQQHGRFRRFAMGDYETLLKEAALSPAMMLYLDNYQSTVLNPNENFARELLELFSIGVGNFTQADVMAAARAGTGYGLRADALAHQFYPVLHDYGQKTFFGITADWDLTGDSGSPTSRDLIHYLCDPAGQGPVVARTLSKLLWEQFAYFAPDAAIVDEVATAFLASGKLKIRDALRAIFMHPEFWDTRAREGKVKDPVEWSVTLLRALGIPPPLLKDLGFDSTSFTIETMGLGLFQQPNVFGWWRRPEDKWIGVPAFQAKSLASAIMASQAGKKRRGKARRWVKKSSPDAIDSIFRACGVILTESDPVRQRGIQFLDETRALGAGRDVEILQLIRYAALSPELQAN